MPAPTMNGLSVRDVEVGPTSTPTSRPAFLLRDVIPAAHTFGAIDQVRLTAAMRDIHTFSMLPYGWDSYGAPPVDRDVLDAARQFLVSLMSNGIEQPALVPTSRGGLAFEWHRPTREFIIELRPASRPTGHVFFANDDDGTEWSSELGEADPRAVGRAFAQLAQAD